MSKVAECFGCTCLTGYLLDTAGDRYGYGANGSCVK